jgi:hypothetical protein
LAANGNARADCLVIAGAVIPLAESTRGVLERTELAIGEGRDESIAEQQV